MAPGSRFRGNDEKSKRIWRGSLQLEPSFEASDLSDTEKEVEALGLPPRAFDKIDAEDDDVFYEPPRLVCHIDEGAIAALTEYYRTVLPAGGVLLDLMSSWVSHLPPEIGYAEVIGHGMNAAELAANPRLNRWFVQNLNRDPVLPLQDRSIDAAMICVSVQYLQRPVAVLREVARVLRPDAPVVISFSNRCFPTKAVAVWRALDDAGHQRLVELYLRHAGFEKVETLRLAEWVEDFSDPMFAVLGRSPTL
ncbi:MAG: methyltransferase domain-containing protein [Alphaproteobacteria bacterium]|nr:methyltransferase domain-containing protein [Alphaproteobacteria bacterium]